MAKVFICMADGCEEVEALSVVDLLRRADITVDMVSVSGKDTVTGSHGITIGMDASLEDTDEGSYDGVILPGGLAGTNILKADQRVIEIIKHFDKEEKLVSAVCAAPTVLGYAGILKDKNATCYPGLEDELFCAAFHEDPVVKDGHVITSRGMGTSIPFGLEIVAYFKGEETAEALAKKIVFPTKKA